MQLHYCDVITLDRYLDRQTDTQMDGWMDRKTV